MIGRCGLLAAGVLLIWLSFPPADLGFLGFAAIVPIVLAVHGSRGPGIFIASYGAGVLLFLLSCFWLSETAFINLLGMSLAEGLVLPLFVLLYRSIGRGSGLPVWLCVPLAWIAAEYVRSVFPLDGFPWLLLGYAAWRIPPLLQTADLCGVWGPGFLMAFCSGVIAARLIEGRLPERRWGSPSFLAGAAFFLLLLAAALGYGLVRPRFIVREPGPVLAAVQGNIPQELKHDTLSFEEVRDRYLEATRRLFDPGRKVLPDLVIWPETIYGLPLSEGAPGEVWYPEKNIGDRLFRNLEEKELIRPVVREVTGPHGAWFLVGALSYRLGPEGELQRRNSVFLYDPGGLRRSSYAKTILVPGGEYLPWIEKMPFAREIKDFVETVAGFLPDLVPGDGPALQRIETPRGSFLFGTDICFENIYGDYCRRFVRMGAQFMVNVSNEGWFGESAEFDQMMAMSLFRAVESRRALFRSTNTGISCVIGPRGRLPGRAERIASGSKDRAVSGVLVQEVPLCASRTLYASWGDFLPKGILSVALLLFFLFLSKALFGKLRRYKEGIKS